MYYFLFACAYTFYGIDWNYLFSQGIPIPLIISHHEWNLLQAATSQLIKELKGKY